MLPCASLWIAIVGRQTAWRTATLATNIIIVITIAVAVVVT
jgi:hypothetical protein